MPRATTGEGPTCPVTPIHGRMLVHPDWGGRYWCPAAIHGGNGRFFTDEEVQTFEHTEADMVQVYETHAQKVIAGDITLDEAVASIGKSSRATTDKIRDRLSTMVEAIKAEQTDRAETREEVKVTRQRKAAEEKTESAAKGARTRKERAATKEPKAPRELVAPEEFAKVRDAAGVSNTAVARAMSLSPSRMTEFTKRVGGTPEQFKAFTAAVKTAKAEAKSKG